jgi:hypothetical protein
MVKGLDRFKEHFAEYSDRYVLIGGTASSMSMEEVGVEFRGTKDLDLVLCVEAFDPQFAEVFWEFIRLGKYETRQKSTGKRLLNDIFRLFTVLERDIRISLAASLRNDLAVAFSLMEQDPPDLKSLGISRITFTEVLNGLREIYNL